MKVWGQEREVVSRALLCEWSSGGLKVPGTGYRRAGQEGLQPRGEQEVGCMWGGTSGVVTACNPAPHPGPRQNEHHHPAAPMGSKPGDKWEPKVSMGFVIIRTDQGGNRDCMSHGSAVDSGRGLASRGGVGRRTSCPRRLWFLTDTRGLGPQAKEGEGG